MGAVRTFRQAQQIRALYEPIKVRLDDVEQYLEQELERALPLVREVAGYVLSCGGKRLRPALVLLVSKLLGYSGDRDVQYAAVVELIHTASLIHDDIIDESDFRRGRPTANSNWGNQATVLVGDWLYARTMELCLELGDTAVIRRFNAAALEMTEGEIMADRVRGDLDIDERVYMEITRRKTAELFAAACSVPALMTPKASRFAEILDRFGGQLGLCFQLIDDILDYTATSSELGKPAMADLCEGRVTLPMILLRPRLDRQQRSAIEQVLKTGAFSEISEAEVIELLDRWGVIAEARERATELAKSASECAGGLPPGRERDALIGATALLVKRHS